MTTKHEGKYFACNGINKNSNSKPTGTGMRDNLKIFLALEDWSAYDIELMATFIDSELSRLHSRIVEEVEPDDEDREYSKSDDLKTAQFYQGKIYGREQAKDVINQAFEDL